MSRAKSTLTCEGGGRVEAPSSKFQAPKKLQAPTAVTQIIDLLCSRFPTSLTSTRDEAPLFWGLELRTSLELGPWTLELRCRIPQCRSLRSILEPWTAVWHPALQHAPRLMKVVCGTSPMKSWPPNVGTCA